MPATLFSFIEYCRSTSRLLIANYRQHDALPNPDSGGFGRGDERGDGEERLGCFEYLNQRILYWDIFYVFAVVEEKKWELFILCSVFPIFPFQEDGLSSTSSPRGICQKQPLLKTSLPSLAFAKDELQEMWVSWRQKEVCLGMAAGRARIWGVLRGGGWVLRTCQIVGVCTCVPEGVGPRRLGPGNKDVPTWISREHLCWGNGHVCGGWPAWTNIRGVP